MFLTDYYINDSDFLPLSHHLSRHLYSVLKISATTKEKLNALLLMQPIRHWALCDFIIVVE